MLNCISDDIKERDVDKARARRVDKYKGKSAFNVNNGGKYKIEG